MTRHAYPASAMHGDYLRAAAGLVPTTAILAATPVSTVAALVLGGLAALFAIFGIRTALRHCTSLELTEAALRASGPLPAAIAWDALDHMKLAYYATGREGKNGWMQLDLRSGWSTLRLDSRIEGFAELVDRAAGAAAARNLPLNETTLANLRALGVSMPAAQAQGPAAEGAL